MSKKKNRDLVLSQIDMYLADIKETQEAIKTLLQAMPGEWVIRRTWLEDGTHTYWGTRNPGDTCYQQGFCFRDPNGVSKGFSGKVSGVKSSKSPRDMLFIAECEAGRDRKYETQNKYIIEVVDRLDGEVYSSVKEPYRNPLLTESQKSR